MRRVAVLAVTLMSAVALGQTEARILLLRDLDTTALADRLRKDLLGLGFTVIDQPAPKAEPTRTTLEDAATQANALAALRLRPSRQGVEVWVADQLSGKLVLREVVLRASDDDNQRVLALRAVELLRASLLELTLAPTPAAPQVTAVETLVRPAPPPPRWSLNLGAGGGLSPGGVAPMLQVVVGGFLRVGEERLLAHGWLSLPTLPGIAADIAGTASLSALFATLGPAYRLTARGSSWDVLVGLDAGLAWVNVSGSGSPGFKGLKRDAFAAALGGSATGAYRFAGGVLVFVQARALVLLPTLSLTFADREGARFGAPVVSAVVGVGLER